MIKRGGIKTVCIAIGIILILTAFLGKDGFNIGTFLLGAIFATLGIVLFKPKKDSTTHTVYVTYNDRTNERKHEPYKNSFRNKEDESTYDVFYKDKGLSLNERVRKLPSDYVVIDLETTGLFPKKNKIIELSALKVRNDMVVDQFTTLCHPGTKISPSVTELTGITNDMVKDAPKINEVLESYVSFHCCPV